MQVIISGEYDGMKLLSFLRGVVGISRAMLTKLKNDSRGILLNGEHVTVRAIISEGDVLELSTEDCAEDENPYLEAVAHPIDVIYEDDETVVVNKAAGMVTHTTHGHYEDSLANALYAKYKAIGRPFVFRAVNRLDRDTSGAVLICKDRLSAFKLSKALQNGEIDKKYIAIVHGRIDGSGDITGYICRCGASIITRRVCDAEEDGALYAHTRYKSLFSSEDFSVLVATPVTGRTHQLRVHFASLGHPIVGDSLYGTDGDVISRQALHAMLIRYPLPFSSDLNAVFAPLPEDMLALCEHIGFDASFLKGML